MSVKPDTEQISYVRPAALPGAELLVAYNSGRPWHVFHERYAFCACREAAAEWRYRGREHDLNDGVTMLLEPGETHRTTDVHKAADFKVLLIPTELFDGAARELGARVTTHFQFAQTRDPRLFRAIYRFCQAVETGATVLEQQSWFTACVDLLLKYAEQRPSTPSSADRSDAVERAKAYLQARFNEPVSLEELAAAAKISRFHLVRSFTRQLGLPPHAYQVHVRLAHARAMLYAGIPPVAVAAQVGFADQSHLTRHFKRVWRTTPADYARQLG